MTTPNKIWLLLDCNYLCYRAHFSTGNLQYGNNPTGVIYGFLRDLKILQNKFDAHRTTVFAWDHGKGLRELAYPKYKQTRRRKKLTDTEEEERECFQSQVRRLKHLIIPDLGYANNFMQKGYEADDVIASVCLLTNSGTIFSDEIVIVSADADLYQLLSHRVKMYNPRTHLLTTRKTFSEEWGIVPANWRIVKAIAGCSTDDISGVKGVGEKTAVKWILGKLLGTKIGERIKEFTLSETYRLNRSLVDLPYRGCKMFTPIKDGKENIKVWEEITTELGMTSLKAKQDGKVRLLDRDTFAGGLDG